MGGFQPKILAITDFDFLETSCQEVFQDFKKPITTNK